MSIAAYEATVVKGRVELAEGIRLPENAKVFVVVTGAEVYPVVHFRSPRLLHQEQAKDFVLEVSEEAPDAGLR